MSNTEWSVPGFKVMHLKEIGSRRPIVTGIDVGQVSHLYPVPTVEAVVILVWVELTARGREVWIAGTNEVDAETVPARYQALHVCRNDDACWSLEENNDTHVFATWRR